FQVARRRPRRSVFLHAGVKICPQETLNEVLASHQGYYQLRVVCQEAVWEAFRIFFDRIPGTTEYQKWVHACQHESLCISDLARNFSGSEEHMIMIHRPIKQKESRAEVQTVAPPKTPPEAPPPSITPTTTLLGPVSVAPSPEPQPTWSAEVLLFALPKDTELPNVVPEAPVEQLVEFSIDLVDPGYRELLDDPDSPQYVDLAHHLQDQMQHAFDKLPGYKDIHVLGIRPRDEKWQQSSLELHSLSTLQVVLSRIKGPDQWSCRVFEVNSPKIVSTGSEATGAPESPVFSGLREMVAKALREEASLPIDLDSLNFQPGGSSSLPSSEPDSHNEFEVSPDEPEEDKIYETEDGKSEGTEPELEIVSEPEQEAPDASEPPEELVPKVPDEAAPDVPEEVVPEVPAEAAPDVPEEAAPDIPDEVVPEVPEEAASEVLELGPKSPPEEEEDLNEVTKAGDEVVQTAESKEPEDVSEPKELPEPSEPEEIPAAEERGVTAPPPLRYLTTPSMTTASHGRELVVFFSLRVTNMDFSEDLFNKTSLEYRSLEGTFLDVLLPYLQANLTGFRDLEILNFRKGSVVVNSKVKFNKSVPYNLTEAVQAVLEEFCSAAARERHIQIDTRSLDVEPADQAGACRFLACGASSRCVVSGLTGEARCVCQPGFLSVDGLPCRSLCLLRPNHCRGGRCQVIPGRGAVCR
uniref:Interphotoreceptor matrix proteoglycan 1 n=1 Tax=Gasterosteus aculeatus TaxID=69293 RepID=G3PD41_GASAC